jgi:alcohol dehydrogenase class IV
MAWTHAQRAQRVVAGDDALGALDAELAAGGAENVLVLCGPHVAASGVLARVRAAAGGRVAAEFAECEPNAPLEVVERVAEIVRRGRLDGLVSVGGGSVHDTAKCAAVLVGEEVDLRAAATSFEPPDRLVVPLLAGPRIPVVAIGTTLSGAEATASAGFHDRAAGTKRVIVDAAAPVRAVILDPELAAATPPAVLAASACNAIHHCVEAVCSRAHEPICDALALAALPRLFAGIEAALDGDRAALADCLAGAYMAGLALPSGGLGVGHAVCHVLGVRGAAHADANAAMLVAGMRFNLPASAERQALLAGALSGGERCEPEAAAELLEGLVARLGVPARLGRLGVEEADRPAIAALALADRHMHANPRRVTQPGELEEVLIAAW